MYVQRFRLKTDYKLQIGEIAAQLLTWIRHIIEIVGILVYKNISRKIKFQQ